ncbi:hypothetical protein BDB01DRAFT_786083 [Pilobolus umbonatus]|nr:hypothetical protein BDB01DRAFT_786083 [Pilobolus umbonatus]
MKLLTSFVVSLQLTSVISIAVSPRYDSYCSYLVDKIFCYGGADATNNVLTEMVALYVHYNSPVDKASLPSSWERIQPLNTLGSEGRKAAQHIATPDRKKMLIQGGYNLANVSLEHPLIIYDAVDNKWTSAPDFTQYGLFGAQIRRAAVSYVSSLNKVLFYGGYMQHTDNQVIRVDNIDVPSEQAVYGSELPFGFHNLTVYDIEKQKWQQFDSAVGQDNSIFVFGSSSVYVPEIDTNFFFEGSTTQRADPAYNEWLSFEEISSVRMSDLQWHKHKCYQDIPTSRDYYTSTLLPNNKTVLIYGGTSDYLTALDDYCYTLDIDTKIYKKCDLNLPISVGPRFGHNAVLVGDHLFILFGANKEGAATDEMVVINVANADSPYSVQSYAYANSFGSTESKGLGTGAIVGIVIGCIAAGVIIGGLIFFFLKKKKSQKAESVQDFPIDWVEIDRGFRRESEVEEVDFTNTSPKMVMVQESTPVTAPADESSVTYSKPDSVAIKPSENILPSKVKPSTS